MNLEENVVVEEALVVEGVPSEQNPETTESVVVSEGIPSEEAVEAEASNVAPEEDADPVNA